MADIRQDDRGGDGGGIISCMPVYRLRFSTPETSQEVRYQHLGPVPALALLRERFPAAQVTEVACVLPPEEWLEPGCNWKHEKPGEFADHSRRWDAWQETGQAEGFIPRVSHFYTSDGLERLDANPVFSMSIPTHTLMPIHLVGMSQRQRLRFALYAARQALPQWYWIFKDDTRLEQALSVVERWFETGQNPVPSNPELRAAGRQANDLIHLAIQQAYAPQTNAADCVQLVCRAALGDDTTWRAIFAATKAGIGRASTQDGDITPSKRMVRVLTRWMAEHAHEE